MMIRLQKIEYNNDKYTQKMKNQAHVMITMESNTIFQNNVITFSHNYRYT